MNYKKIIIILLILIILLGSLFIIFVMNKSTAQSNNKSGAIPTGIIIPTKEITSNTLDIVSIDPQDQATNISPDKKITITFSKQFTETDIIFSLTPNTPYSQIVEGNKLIITPSSSWDSGTEYGYSVNFTNDNQKVRLYRFKTTGPTPEFLPDTQPQGLYEEERNNQKEDDPNLYVSNETPYETGTFYVTSEYEPTPPAHFYMIVTLKDQNRGREDFNVWLQSLNLTQEQIDSLDVRYQ